MWAIPYAVDEVAVITHAFVELEGRALKVSAAASTAQPAVTAAARTRLESRRHTSRYGRGASAEE